MTDAVLMRGAWFAVCGAWGVLCDLRIALRAAMRGDSVGNKMDVKI